jgi:hypothetical protein
VIRNLKKLKGLTGGDILKGLTGGDIWADGADLGDLSRGIF